jgi:hypothetical protein
MKKIIFTFFLVMLVGGCGESEQEKDKRIDACVDRKEASLKSTCLRACGVNPIDTKCGQEYIDGSASGYCIREMKAKLFSEQVEECEKSCRIPFDQSMEILESCF